MPQVWPQKRQKKKKKSLKKKDIPFKYLSKESGSGYTTKDVNVFIFCKDKRNQFEET